MQLEPGQAVDSPPSCQPLRWLGFGQQCVPQVPCNSAVDDGTLLATLCNKLGPRCL